MRDKNPNKRHTRIEAHNVVRLCQEFPEKYPAPSEFYFGEIDSIFSPSKDAEIDLTVLRVKGEIEKEDFDKKQNVAKQPTVQQSAYQNPLIKREDGDGEW